MHDANLIGSCQQPREARSSDPSAGHGHCGQNTAQRLHPPHRSRIAILFSWLSENPAPARVQGIDVWQR